MESSICRGCQQPFLDKNTGKNIFTDDVLIKSINCDKTWNIKLFSAIELITGLKETKEENLPQKVCEMCFKNVEAYVNFRYQLIKSRNILINSYQNAKGVSDVSTAETSILISNDSSPNITVNKKDQKLPNVSLFYQEFPSSPLLSKTIVNDLSPKVLSDDLINVDESSTSLDLDSIHNEDGETSDSIVDKLQNDQENNNLNDSENSVDNATNLNIEEVDVKQPDHDIESEIDVCSGEDDDVLELDVQKRKNETVEIDSSSESDIEVCDYEPIGKRRNYNNFSPPIRF